MTQGGIAGGLKDATGRDALVRRLLPGLMALGAILAFTALWVDGAHAAYFALLKLAGVPVFRLPFLDAHGVLAAIDCHWRGIDVYLTNPCDIKGRVHVYTPLWFRLGALPIDSSMTPAVGLILAVAFAASLALLPPGRDARATAIICAAAVSPVVAFALERGNADVLLFVFAALVGSLAWRRLPTRLLAFPVIVLAALLKVYPAALLLLALRERPRLALAIVGTAAGAMLAYAAANAADLRKMLAVIPYSRPFHYTFGLRDLPDGLGGGLGWSAATVMLAAATMLVAAVLLAAVHADPLRAASGALTPAEKAGLLIGACLIVGCFVTGQSIEYRAIHLLFVLPGLTALAGAPGPARSLATRMVWIMLLQLWGDVVSAGLWTLTEPGHAHAGTAVKAFLVVWTARALAWWWIVAMLMALLAGLLPAGLLPAGLLPAGRGNWVRGLLMFGRRPAAATRPGLSPPLRRGDPG